MLDAFLVKELILWTSLELESNELTFKTLKVTDTTGGLVSKFLPPQKKLARDT